MKAPQQIPRPGIFSDATAAKMLAKNLKGAETRVKKLRDRMTKALKEPAAHDPVYKTCQRLFHKTDELTLTRENPIRRTIRHRAFRRFLHGYPPRKRNDTSIGDAFNWEWMVHCATQKKAGLVIVTRDSDYGLTVDKDSYINDALRQEFSERVSRKRDLRLYSRLSDALKFFDVKVTRQEEATEAELVSELNRFPAELSDQQLITRNSYRDLWSRYYDDRPPYRSKMSLGTLIGRPRPAEAFVEIDNPVIPPFEAESELSDPDTGKSRHLFQSFVTRNQSDPR